MVITNHSDNKIKLIVFSGSSGLAFRDNDTSSKYSLGVWNLFIKKKIS